MAVGIGIHVNVWASNCRLVCSELFDSLIVYCASANVMWQEALLVHERSAIMTLVVSQCVRPWVCLSVCLSVCIFKMLLFRQFLSE